jgi:hypothetical protein
VAEQDASALPQAEAERRRVLCTLRSDLDRQSAAVDERRREEAEAAAALRALRERHAALVAQRDALSASQGAAAAGLPADAATARRRAAEKAARALLEKASPVPLLRSTFFVAGCAARSAAPRYGRAPRKQALGRGQCG